MTRNLSVSKARQSFLKLLRSLERHPDWSFNVLRSGRVIARITAALPMAEGPTPWRALLEIAKEEEKRGRRRRKHRISENVDAELVRIYAGKA